jgi:hypothetical protein
MKRFFPHLLVVIVVLAFSNTSGAQCPEDTLDLGICDTLYVEPFFHTDTCFIAGAETICVNNPGEEFPCFLFVSLFVTHDSNTFYWLNHDPPIWVQDSIALFVVPLNFWHDSEGDGKVIFPTSNQFNNSRQDPGHVLFPKSMFRHIEDENGDTIYNRFALMVGPPEYLPEWAVTLDKDTLASVGDSGHIFLALIPQTDACRRWWEGSRVLLATLTFIVSDMMHVYMDSTFWPPGGRLEFTRQDAINYVPRHDLPLSIWVGPPRLQIISPNGGETWCVGSTETITWLSENFTDDVKIEYSTNGGADWIEIVSSTENDGRYPWIVENTPSANCRVKVSGAADGEPKDSSDASFTILGESITVTSPNGGEEFVAGDPLSITWTSTCFTGSVDIFLSEDGGANWDTIVSGTENDGEHQTLILQSVSTNQGLIKIADSDNGDPSDQSDDFFTVSNFTIRSEPETLFIAASTNKNCRVILESQFGFNLPCTLTVDEDSLPQSTTYDFNPNTLVPTDTSILTFHTDLSTPPDTTTIIVTGSMMFDTKNGLKHSTQLVLIVTPPPDFNIQAEPETLTVGPGDSIECKVILESLYGFVSPCTLTLQEDSLPQNTTYHFNPVTLVPTDTSILTFYTDVSTPPGTSVIIITGTEISGGKNNIEHSTQVILIVPPPDFTIEAKPETLPVNPGDNVNCNVILESMYGFSSPCTLTLEEDSLPENTTYDFNPATLVPTDTSILIFHTDVSTPACTRTIIITGSEISQGKEGIEHSTQVVLIVAPPRIEVKLPNGGEHWCIGETREITWSFEGSPVPFVKIEYSVNGGVGWESIADSTQNDGEYIWTIPNVPSDSCLIKVSDAEDGNPWDRSDDFFIIYQVGDANANGIINIADIVYLINYLFKTGPPPIPQEAGDVNADVSVNVADIVYLINFLFKGGPPLFCEPASAVH